MPNNTVLCRQDDSIRNPSKQASKLIHTEKIFQSPVRSIPFPNETPWHTVSESSSPQPGCRVPAMPGGKEAPLDLQRSTRSCVMGMYAVCHGQWPTHGAGVRLHPGKGGGVGPLGHSAKNGEMHFGQFFEYFKYLPPAPGGRRSAISWPTPPPGEPYHCFRCVQPTSGGGGDWLLATDLPSPLGWVRPWLGLSQNEPLWRHRVHRGVALGRLWVAGPSPHKARPHLLGLGRPKDTCVRQP